MKNLNGIVLLCTVFLLACQKEDNPPLNPTNQTTFFGEGGETYHTGIDLHHHSSHFYKRDNTGNILWSLEIEKQAESNDQIIVLEDGSSILYALGNNSFYKISSTGQLIWKSTFENADFYIHVNADHLWIPIVETLSIGMLVVDIDTGEQLDKILLPDIYKPQLQQYHFTYKDGAMYLAAYMELSHVDLIKFDETGQLWRESNEETIDDYKIVKVMPLTNGLAILFLNSIVCTFDANGLLTERFTLETTADLTFTIKSITKEDGTLELFALNPDDTFSLIWISLDADGKLEDSKTISMPYETPYLADYKFTNEGILLSVFNNESDAKEEDRILLKNDGTYEVIL